jgi:hypothetical protein
MSDLQYLSSIKTSLRKKYYDENALKAYKEDINSFTKDQTNSSKYSYSVINDFLKVNNVNSNGKNIINIKLTKANKEKAKNIITIVKGIDKRMVPYDSTKKLYKGITHISKVTLDNNTPIIYKGYSSTTENYKTALEFADTKQEDHKIILILSLNPEIKVYNYNDKYNEYEILVERNTIMSNFIYKKYDTENNVHVYNAIVSKYNPDILYIPPKEASYFLDFKHNSTKLPEEAHYFLDLKYDATKSPKKIKIFDITRTKKKHSKH